MILFDEVLKDAAQVQSAYRDICRCRDDLLGFLDRNGWFGQAPEGSGREMAVSDYESMRGPIRLWLSAYQRTPREKLSVLLDTYSGQLPETCRRYRKFVAREGISDEPSGWKILDFILSACGRELSGYSAEELDCLMEKTSEMLPVRSTKLFAKFAAEVSGDSSCRYDIHPRRQAEIRKEAYPVREFSVMAYCVFNEASWEANGLVIKALDSVRYADLWLFAALHFLGALRQTDITRLPVPSLPYPPDTVEGMLRSGSYRDADARGVSEELLLRLKYLPMYPSKTERYQGVPELKLFIPESLKAAMGLIITIKLLHHKENEPLVRPVQDIVSIRRFFGTQFIEALGERRFQTRRANKSYLQGIELVTADGPGRPKGYMLAALARSHKGGIGALPEITDIYLKDAAFSGYRPEFILREMFERGIFGFIPVLLLERYAGDGYRRLDVPRQTELIRCIGLDAGQLEEAALLVERSLEASREIVASIPEGRLGDALQMAASGAAASRQPETLCLRTAVGMPCCDSLRGGCIGCGYEIFTKAAFHLLMKEYTAITELKNRASGPERERLKNILSRGIIPAVGQMLESLPMLYPGADMETMTGMLERRLKDTDDSRCADA